MDNPFKTPKRKYVEETTPDEDYIYAPFDDEDNTTSQSQSPTVSIPIEEIRETTVNDLEVPDIKSRPASNQGGVDVEIDWMPGWTKEQSKQSQKEYTEATQKQAPSPADDEDIQETIDEDIEPQVETVSKEEFDELQNRYNRLMADWENYRRRTAEDIAVAKTNANKNLMEALIPALDNFGLALNHAKTLNDNQAVVNMANGFDAIYRALFDNLSREGLNVIAPAEGEPFNINIHQAVEKVSDTDYEPDTVVKTVQVGYKFNDYIIRPALVGVSI